MAQKKIHGVVTTNGRGVPGRVVNIRSKKHIKNNKIRLDKLIRSARPKILIKRRLGGIGDVIMSTPLLKHIKRLIPNCELTYATDLNYAWGALGEVIKHNPYVDILVGNGEYKESDYDYSVDITATGLNREKSGSIPPNRIDMFAEEAGVSISSDPEPDWIVTGPEKELAEEFLKQYTPEGMKTEDVKFIMIQCRSNDARRTWPAEYVEKLARILAEDPNNVMLMMDWGSSVDSWTEGERIHVIKDQPIEETAAVMERCALMICPDSALLHLAGALRVKTVTIFGPIPPESRINHYPNCTAVYRKLPCSFCWYTPKCNKHKGSKLECLTKLMPETVAEAAVEKMMEPMKTSLNIRKGKDFTDKGQDPIILVKRQHGGLGDILMTGPALEALKLKYPDKEIHYAIPTEYHNLMRNLPFIDRLIDVHSPINYKRYYLIMDITHCDSRYECARVSQKKPVQKSRVEIYAEALGVRDLLVSHTPRYNPTPEEIKWAEVFIKSQPIDKNKPIVGIQLESAEEYRNYPRNKFNKLISLLEKDFNILCFGSEASRIDHPSVIDLCGFPIRKWAALMTQCNVFITVDTGPLHVAAALKINTVALFGPIDYKARCKGYETVTALVALMDCIPCWRNCNIKCKQTGEIKGYSKCLNSIPTTAIANIAKQKSKETK